MDFFIPEEMRIINKVLVKIRIGRFRAYSKSTESDAAKVVTSSTTDDETRTSSDGGATRTTSSSGGGSQATSSAGGGSQTTSSSGGGSQTTSSSGGGASTTSEGGGGSTTDTGTSGINVVYDYGQTELGGSDKHGHKFRYVRSHQHRVTFQDHTHRVEIPSHIHSISIPSHTHNVSIPSHTHDVRIPSHTHEVSIPNHRHTITIRGHSHKVTVPAHSHSITPGIFRFGNPKAFALYVNGVKKADFSGGTAELDITGYLLDKDRRIPRGSWLSLEVRPDDLAYISLDLMVQGFVQSRGDMTV